jgi:hypothetical protein
MRCIVICGGNHQGPDIVAYYRGSFQRLLKVGCVSSMFKVKGRDRRKRRTKNC